ncbi:type II secretion system protein J, partial [Desulfobacula sp.]
CTPVHEDFKLLQQRSRWVSFRSNTNFISRIHSTREKGFTLLELLVAMLMVSMVTIIIAQALKLSINSWDRAQREGDTFQARIVIPSLLRKQLDSIVREKVFAQGQAPVKLVFKGNEKGLSFFTSFTPMAGNLTGLLRVTYVHDKEKSTLFLYQKLILTLEDLKDIYCPLSEVWDRQLEPSGKIVGTRLFDIRYSKEKSLSDTDSDSVANIWENTKNQYPGSIFLNFQTIAKKMTSNPELWHFNIGT